MKSWSPASEPSASASETRRNVCVLLWTLRCQAPIRLHIPLTSIIQIFTTLSTPEVVRDSRYLSEFNIFWSLKYIHVSGSKMEMCHQVVG
jgi:hypothetical protein